MTKILNALAIQFYRGIGAHTQYIYPFSKLNFFIGENNSGKSIVLNFICEQFPDPQLKPKEISIGSPEYFRGTQTGFPAGAIGIPVKNFEAQAVKRRLEQLGITNKNTLEEAASGASLALARNDHIWITYDSKSTFNSLRTLPKPEYFKTAPDSERIQSANAQNWKKFHNQFDSIHTSGGAPAYADLLFRKLLDLQDLTFPERLIIPAKRQLGPKDQTFNDQSGKGLIDHLANIQNPDHNEREKRKVFDNINAFVQVVTGKMDATLEVPSNRDHLLVHIDNKVLPLSSLGTGIHEVILIAAFCTIHQNKIMCIEEPEIHLHPTLQRKLIAYLQEHTENQYFIATHSAAFIDTPNASVFNVRNDGVQTYVTPAITNDDKRKICDDLGYRPSDLLQTNAVIWVEGPSDRTYIRHWLLAADSDLQEGVHYTIMFYGGSLIRYLSADDESLSEFIKLKSLNRHMTIVIDSDRSAPRSPLKPAARRIMKEFKDGSASVWITMGREMENYIDPDVLHEALKTAHPKIYNGRLKVGRFDHPFYFKSKGKKPQNPFKEADKVRVANLVCKKPADFTILDLRKRVNELAGMIRRANGLL